MFYLDVITIGIIYIYIYIKGKAVQLQAWSGAGCSRKLSLPDYVTMFQDCGKFVSLTHRLYIVRAT